MQLMLRAEHVFYCTPLLAFFQLSQVHAFTFQAMKLLLQKSFQRKYLKASDVEGTPSVKRIIIIIVNYRLSAGCTTSGGFRFLAVRDPFNLTDWFYKQTVRNIRHII